MANKKFETDPEKLHQLAHKVFDESSSEFADLISAHISKQKEKYPSVGENNFYDVVIQPTMASIMSAATAHMFYFDYSKGDILEMVCDFYLNAEISKDESSEDEGDDGTKLKGAATPDKNNIN